ncbi:hypothetical protein NEMIN01_1470 [Nematocida minor]|uniref:uncharacterized protein n=1 Tax=Nematocida minor TaxID=1912983 RepID=UPI002220C4CF|nr:uncharacterized protein NEMIN01_1470 [Nematocida minor]KAI5191311.1 hypothetical protein NEMIN01_1470 [Nematocida minor]
MGWKDYEYAFYTYTDCISDLEFLQLLCDEFSWHLYAEENKQGANYMISGKTFVIDIFYEREEKENQQDDGEDAQSMGSSVIQIGKERVESIYRAIKKVDISLIEEEWSSYFRIFTFSIMLHLKNREYYNVYKLLKNLLQYDTEEEHKGFGSVIKELKGVEGHGVESVDYSFLQHKPVRYHRINSTSRLYSMLGLFSYVQPDYTYKLYNLSDVENKLENSTHVEIIVEMLLYNVDISIEKENIVINGKINGEYCRVEINSDGYVLVDGTVDKYRTLLLKRTESMYHVIRETEIEVSEHSA